MDLEAETVPPPAAHYSVVVVDVEGFSDEKRTNTHQVTIRKRMYEALKRAFASAGLAWQECVVEDRGDGAMVLVPAHVPKKLLACELPAALAAEIGRHTAAGAAPTAFRMRMALHAGEVHSDDRGVAGTAVILPFRLIDAAELKESLRSSRAVLALVVSDWFFHEVVKHYAEAEPLLFRTVRISVKNVKADAWIRLLGGAGAEPRDAPAEPAPEWPPPLSASHLPRPELRQLPLPASGFTGRSEQLAWLDRALTTATERQEASMAVVHGMPGVGKTTLAVQWAHRAAEHFPDGQLYIDLHGHSPKATLSPGAALGRLLRSLGIPDQQIPLEEEERATLYRTTVARRRLLLLLDNAASTEQVRPLLPGTSESFVLITSRARLGGLAARDGARLLDLEVMPTAEATTLVRETLRAACRNSTPGQLDSIARLCGRLPLALRIAVEFIAARDKVPLVELVDELADERHRLELLSTGDDETTAVQAAFSWSYRALPADAARVFTLMGLHPGPDMDSAAVAALTGLTIARARRCLSTLVRLHLVEETEGRRYRMHDLLGLYAAGLAAELPSGKSDEAVTRLLGWYLCVLTAADRAKAPRGFGGALPVPVVQPQIDFASHDAALTWYESEHANLIALLTLAGRTGRDEMASRLPVAMAGFFLLRKPWNDWISSHEIGLAGALRSGDRHGEAWLRCHLALAERELRRSAPALTDAREASVLFRKLGDPSGLAFADTVCGLVYRDQRLLDEARDHLARALRTYLDIGDLWGEGIALVTLGIVLRDLMRHPEALDHCRRAVRVFRGIGDQWGEGVALATGAQISRDLGQFDQVIDTCGRAISIQQAIGDRHTEGMIRNTLGTALLRMGRTEHAIDRAREALKIFREIGDRHGEGIALKNLGVALNTAGRPLEAKQCWLLSLELLEAIGSPRADVVRGHLAGLTTEGDQDRPSSAAGSDTVPRTVA
ncbi:tetratricopeptide repeat protein [Actinomadura welshii]|uniref:tetratricopeptide repeat protein n=1 Tax=Actinomadura welshii TaxID=3103817 RepID=UPI0003ACFF83|nr:tetratricopeptide repeat protein [Actinomadura madurae]